MIRRAAYQQVLVVERSPSSPASINCFSYNLDDRTSSTKQGTNAPFARSQQSPPHGLAGDSHNDAESDSTSRVHSTLSTVSAPPRESTSCIRVYARKIPVHIIKKSYAVLLKDLEGLAPQLLSIWTDNGTLLFSRVPAIDDTDDHTQVSNLTSEVDSRNQPSLDTVYRTRSHDSPIPPSTTVGPTPPNLAQDGSHRLSTRCLAALEGFLAFVKSQSEHSDPPKQPAPTPTPINSVTATYIPIPEEMKECVWIVYTTKPRLLNGVTSGTTAAVTIRSSSINTATPTVNSEVIHGEDPIVEPRAFREQVEHRAQTQDPSTGVASQRVPPSPYARLQGSNKDAIQGEADHQDPRQPSGHRNRNCHNGSAGWYEVQNDGETSDMVSATTRQSSCAKEGLVASSTLIGVKGQKSEHDPMVGCDSVLHEHVRDHERDWRGPRSISASPKGEQAQLISQSSLPSSFEFVTTTAEAAKVVLTVAHGRAGDEISRAEDVNEDVGPRVAQANYDSSQPQLYQRQDLPKATTVAIPTSLINHSESQLASGTMLSATSCTADIGLGASHGYSGTRSSAVDRRGDGSLSHGHGQGGNFCGCHLNHNHNHSQASHHCVMHSHLTELAQAVITLLDAESTATSPSTTSTLSALPSTRVPLSPPLSSTSTTTMPPPIPPKPQTLTQEQYCVVDASFYDPIDSYIPLRSVDPVNTGLLTPDTSPVSTPVISFINTKSDRSLSVPSVIAKLDIPPPSTHVATVGYATSALHYNASIESESPGQSDTDQVRGREPMLQESVTSHFSGYRMSLSTTAPSVLDTRPASHAMYSVTSFENSGPGPQLTGRSSSSSGSSSSGNGSEGNEGVSGRNHDGATTASARSSEQKYQQRRRLSDIISRNVRSRKNSILAIFGSHPSEELQQQSLDQKQQQQRRSTTTSSSDSSHKLVRKDKKKLDKKQKKKDLYHNSGGSNGSSSSSSDGSNGRDTSGQSSVEECMTGKSGGNMIQRASWYMRRSSTSGDRTTSESSTRPEPASRPRSESASSSTVFAKRLSASLNFSPKLSFVPTARSVSSSALPVTTGSGSLSSSSERSTPSPPLAPISSQSSQPLLQLPPRQRLSHQFQAQFYTSQEMASRHLPTSTSESEPNRRRRDVDLMLDLDDTNNSRQSQPPSPPYERYANSGAYPTSPTLPPPPPPPYRPRSMTISGRYAPGSVPLSAQYRYAMSSGNTCATGSLFDSVSDSDSDDSDVDDGYGFRYASPPPVQPRVVPHYPELPSPREVQTLCGSDASRGQLSSSQEYTSSSQYRVYDSDDDMEDDTSENESDSQDDEDDEEDDEEEEPLQTWRQQQQQQQQHQQESQVVIGGDRRRRQTLEGYMHRFDEGAPPPSYEQLQQQQGPAVTLESSANLGTLLELLHEFEDHLLESSRTLGFQSLTNTGSVPSRRQAWLGRQPQTMPSFAYIMIELEQLGILGSAKVSAWTEPMAGLGTLTMSQQEWLDRTGNATTEAQLARSMLALEKSCVLGMDHARWVPETQRRWRARLLALADA